MIPTANVLFVVLVIVFVAIIVIAMLFVALAMVISVATAMGNAGLPERKTIPNTQTENHLIPFIESLLVEVG